MSLWSLVLLSVSCDPAPALTGKQQFESGRFAAAEESFRRALLMPCGAAQEISDRINLAATLRELGRNYEALRIFWEWKDDGSAPVDLRAGYWNSRSIAEEEAGDTAMAESCLRRALSAVEVRAPARLRIQILTNAARHWLRRGRLQEAERALNDVRLEPGWNHEKPFSYDLNLAELRRLQGKGREAEALMRGALEKTGAPAHLRAVVANNLASICSSRGERKEAEAHWERAIALWREAYGFRHPIVAKALNNLAAHHYYAGRYDRAEPLFREALELDENPMGLNNLGALYHRRKRYGDAERLYHRSLAAFAKRGEMSRDTIQPHGNLALLLADTAREEEALEAFQQMMKVLPAAVPYDEPMAARYLERYEKLLRARCEPAEAERVAALAMRYRVKAALRE